MNIKNLIINPFNATNELICLTAALPRNWIIALWLLNNNGVKLLIYLLVYNYLLVDMSHSVKREAENGF